MRCQTCQTVFVRGQELTPPFADAKYSEISSHWRFLADAFPWRRWRCVIGGSLPRTTFGDTH
jgi:hypothetical protein